MGYMDGVKIFAPILRANNLDGSSRLTGKKRLAIGHVVDLYEGVTPRQVERDSDLRSRMETDLVQFYQVLEGVHPQPQVVYLDLSAFKNFYESTLQSITHQSFADWQKELLQELENHYRLPDGKTLNVHFTTAKPKEKHCLSVDFSPLEFDDYMYADEERKATLPLSFIYEKGKEHEQAKRIQAIIERVKASLGKKAKERQIMLKVAEDTEFKKMVGEGGFGRYIRSSEIEFGNPTKNDLIWIGAGKFYNAYQRAIVFLARLSPEQRIQLSQTQLPPGGTFGSFVPWIAQDNGKNMVKAFAEVAAHEIGHALGLNHPGARLSNLRGQIPVPKRKGHLMDTNLLRDRVRPQIAIFNDFSLDYLRYVLGDVEK